MICKKCGAENAESCRYCVGCGDRLTAVGKKKPRPSSPTALRIALLVLFALLIVLLLYLILR